MEKWHVGCSGFHYKHWRGTFYPEKLAVKNWFSYYTEHFDTLELNVTFYRFPTVPLLTTWYEKSAANFRFAVKAPRLITHYKKFIDTDRLMDDFYRTVDLGLKEKCGCCLFQLPPNYYYSGERLEKIISSLHKDFNNVMEFRHESWWQEVVYQELAKHNISFCGMSHPDLPKDIVKNTSLFYFRLHGEEQLYASRYSDKQLHDFANEIMSGKEIREGYIFFNNDINTNAVYNAKVFKEILKHPHS
ncbi:uncharacterized protein YecE (DUF72 family) [Pedobacter sp. CAN_A7]|uniref:DUF72 domain-containing protein n=1 Tax=Pedobacter sp. CAN_A7 TaxID=2787722 RepID=UPI0018CA0513